MAEIYPACQGRSLRRRLHIRIACAKGGYTFNLKKGVQYLTRIWEPFHLSVIELISYLRMIKLSNARSGYTYRTLKQEVHIGVLIKQDPGFNKNKSHQGKSQKSKIKFEVSVKHQIMKVI